MSIYEITTTIKKIIVILLHNWFEKFWNKIKLYEKYKKKKSWHSENFILFWNVYFGCGSANFSKYV